MANNNTRETYWKDSYLVPHEDPPELNQNSFWAMISSVDGKRGALEAEARELRSQTITPAVASGSYMPPDGESRANESREMRERTHKLNYDESKLTLSHRVMQWFGFRGDGEENAVETVIEGPRTKFDGARVQFLRVDSGGFSHSSDNLAQNYRRRRT